MDMITRDDLLERAAQVVEKGWTQASNARDERGDRVGPTLPQAVCWCLNGALVKVAGGYTNGVYDILYASVAAVRSNPVEWNDALSEGSGATVAALLRSVKGTPMPVIVDDPAL